jgi:hypothetical protein
VGYVTNTNEIRRWYRTLGLEPGCDWNDIRAVYRRLAQKWHPDRFPEGSPEGEEARRKIVQINQAYQSLSDYRRRHGSLPRFPKETSANPSRESQGSSWATQPSSVFDDGWKGRRRDHDSDRGTRARWRPRLIWLLGLSLVVLFGYDELFPPPSPDATRYSALDKADNRGPDRDLVSPAPSPGIATTDASSYFTIGSSRQDVLRIQGTPSRVTEDTWHYGRSKVFFENGKVSGWKESPGDPLSAIPPQEEAPAPADAPTRNVQFSIGSTKAEVLAAQGEPIIKTDTLWDYGVSKVYFRRGRVSGWYNSPIDPLHTKE